MLYKCPYKQIRNEYIRFEWPFLPDFSTIRLIIIRLIKRCLKIFGLDIRHVDMSLKLNKVLI